VKGLSVRPVQLAALERTGWTALHQSLYDSRVPNLTLTDDELRDAGQAARLAARLAQKDAAAQSNPRIQATFAADAERYDELAVKYDAARQYRGR
jgi:hypothetical protein